MYFDNVIFLYLDKKILSEILIVWISINLGNLVWMKLNKTLRFLYVCQTYPKQIKNQAN